MLLRSFCVYPGQAIAAGSCGSRQGAADIQVRWAPRLTRVVGIDAKTGRRASSRRGRADGGGDGSHTPSTSIGWVPVASPQRIAEIPWQPQDTALARERYTEHVS